MEVFKLMTPDPETVFIEHSLTEVMKRMDMSQTDYIFVVDGDQLVGIIDRKTVQQKLNDNSGKVANHQLSEVMSSEVLVVSIDETSATARTAMFENGHRIAAVVDQNGQLVGTVRLEQVNGDKPVSSISPSDKALPKDAQRTVPSPPAPDEGSLGKPQRDYSVKPTIVRPGDETSDEDK